MPTTARLSAHRAAGAGFTLLEVLITLGLVATLLIGLSAGVGRLTRSDERREVRELTGAMRYLFGRASTTGKVYRLVIDFEERVYFAEVSDDRIYMPSERETEEARLEQIERELEEAEAESDTEAESNGFEGDRDDDDYEDSFEASSGDDWGEEGVGSWEAMAEDLPYDLETLEPKDFKPKQPRFENFSERNLKKKSFKKLKPIALFTPRLAEPMASGQGYIYFFPLGFAENAYIHFSDEAEEEFKTVILEPLTGRIRVYNAYIDPPVEEQFDDEGNVIAP